MRIAGQDRARLERLLRYCARPPFALEQLEQVSKHQIIYHLPKPRRDGRTALAFTPLELIDHVAALIPPPRLAQPQAALSERSFTGTLPFVPAVGRLDFLFRYP